jgi:hydrogenase maturation protein HypF
MINQHRDHLIGANSHVSISECIDRRFKNTIYFPISKSSRVSSKQLLIIGLGNPWRKDDGIGPALIARLQENPELNIHADCVDGGTDGLGLVSIIEPYERALIVDAVRMGLAPGTIKVFTPDDVILNVHSDSLSTHGFGLAQVIELLRKMGNTTALTIVGIEPESVGFGEGLSPVVEKSLPEVIKIIFNDSNPPFGEFRRPDKRGYQIHITGLVQGVGFRSYIYRLATGYHLNGWVRNCSDGVQILVWGPKKTMKQFLSDIPNLAPPPARVRELVHHEIPIATLEKIPECFEIIPSVTISLQTTEVSPDLAVCEECLGDMGIMGEGDIPRATLHALHSTRFQYPFTNCTHCGPRFSIIRELPYDRRHTTMDPFTMCPDCQREYENPKDRRFHAQPNACARCGPRISLTHPDSQTPSPQDPKTIISELAGYLESGKIVAIKGVGGFHLACDAANEAAVAMLRARKRREGKPFAVMVRDLATVRELVEVSQDEAALLTSTPRPIVLLSGPRRGGIAPSVTQGLPTLGVMLPYTPLHTLLFDHLTIPAIVLTSGNLSDEPIVIDNADAVKKFGTIADAVLTYNRDIYNRCDDSVTAVIHHQPRILRRSRGFAPESIALTMNVDGIVAVGAELKNCFCLGKNNQAILSQHIGDLKNVETLEFFTESLERFKKLFRVTPTRIAHDLHPDYLSTRYAIETGLPLIAVQHHHAHIASCMAEHGLAEPVIGVSFDGTGYGDDGAIWGGEFLVADLAGYRRAAHLEYTPMPGGEKAISEPWRMAVAVLHQTFGREILNMNLPFMNPVGAKKFSPLPNIPLILDAIDKKINAPLTSSMGRLFDGVAAILGIGHTVRFEAEAAMRMEGMAAAGVDAKYPFEIIHPVGAKNFSPLPTMISVQPMIRAIVTDLQHNVPREKIAAIFHNTVVAMMVATCQKLREETGLNKVVLSGGVFQNRYILERAEQLLAKGQFRVYSHCKVPTNDGGIALGQAAVAATW